MVVIVGLTRRVDVDVGVAGAVTFVTVALLASTVYVVPFMPVSVIVLPLIAVTVPAAAGLGPLWLPMLPPKPPIILPSTIDVAVTVVPETVPCTLMVSPTAI